MKTTVTLYGRPLMQIRIGCAAFIREESRDRRTSVVLKIRRTSRREIVFETVNTVYRLRLDTHRIDRNGGLHV